MSNLKRRKVPAGKPMKFCKGGHPKPVRAAGNGDYCASCIAFKEAAKQKAGGTKAPVIARK
jgi:hypothetical protein